MGATTPKQLRAKGLSELGTLFRAGDASTPDAWSVERLKAVSELDVHVIAGEHANADSLPLRFGVHFESDAVITLKRVEFSRVDADHADRFHVEAWCAISGGGDLSGHFVLGQRRGFANLVLVTVWRNDADTELGLSEVMKALRQRGILTPTTLKRLYPLYRDGKLRTHADLVECLARELSEREVSEMRRATDEALAQLDAALAERDQANDRVGKLEAELSAELERFQREIDAARRDGQTATLSTPNTLLQVVEDEIYRGSSCTVLVMGDGSRRFMKTATFDRDGSVTAKAKSLVGRRVRISCWDPVGQPGRWSSEGYFRNVYAAE